MSDQNGLLTPSNLLPRQTAVTKKRVARTLLSTAIVSLLYAVPSVAVETELDTVTVTASRFETPLREIGASLTVIDREEIENRGYQTITDLLRTQVGLAANTSGGEGSTSSLRIRGEDGYRTLILIDGVDISDPTGTQAGPAIEHLLATGEVERIEILRGPQGFIYGADAGGVIQIFTKEPSDEVEGLVATEYGRYDSSTVNGYVSAGSELGGLFLSVNRRKTNGFNAFSDDINDEADGYENETFHGKYQWQLPNDISAQMVYRQTEAENEYDNCFDSTGREDCVNLYDQRIAKISFLHDAGSLEQSGAMTWNEVDREFFTAGIAGFATEGEATKAEYLAKVQMTSQITLQFGADIQDETVFVEGSEDLEQNQYGVFTEIQSSLWESTVMTAGLRYDDNDEVGEHVSYRATAAYLQPLNRFDQIKWRVSAGSGFRAPSLSEQAYNSGPFAFGVAADTVLEEEQSRGFDVGADLYLGTGTTLSATYFDQRITDQIVFDLVGFSGYLQLEGESRSRGIEIESDFVVTNQVNIFANFTYNDTEMTDAEQLIQGVSGSEQRFRRPKRVANVGTSFRGFNQKLSLLMNIRIVRDNIGNGAVELEDFEVIDVSGRYQFTPNIELTGRIENLGDEDYQEIDGFETAGQGVYAGINVSL